MLSKSPICVTGASGFIASEIVKQLLGAGYTVNGTVRDRANEEKVQHLKAFPGAERLNLFDADLMSADSFDDAVKGCEFVMHTASPFFRGSANPEEELLQPAVQGTLALLNACARAGTVRRVVLTSSMAAVSHDRFAHADRRVYDEDSWTDEAAARAAGCWYEVSKTAAERAAWEFVKTASFDLVCINPCLVAGPVHQRTLNTSSKVLMEYVNGSKQTIPRGTTAYVDVRDVAAAHVAAMRPTAQGRYILNHSSLSHADMCALISRVAGDDARVPTALEDGDGNATGGKAIPDVRNDKVKKLLGRDLLPLEDTVAAALVDLRRHGHWRPV